MKIEIINSDSAAVLYLFSFSFSLLMGDFSIGTNFTIQRECGAGSNYRMDGSVYINKYNMNAYSFVDAFRQKKKNEKTRHQNEQLEEERKKTH